jgi:hypothetical protein
MALPVHYRPNQLLSHRIPSSQECEIRCGPLAVRLVTGSPLFGFGSFMGAGISLLRH